MIFYSIRHIYICVFERNICCHDGRVFIYNANELIDEDLYAAYVKKYKLEGKSEFDAQWAALESIKENADINFKEVSAYE